MAVKLSLKDENVYEGEIFAVDPVTSTVVMQCGEEYKIVFGDQVTKIDGAMTANCAPGVPPSLVRDQREDKALRNAEKRLEDINLNVSSHAQKIFDEINFVFESEWDGDRIIINKTYAVQPPYSEVTCINDKSNDKTFTARLVKALERARTKAGL